MGDSRAVLGYIEDGIQKVKPLSNDHKPDLPNERSRILASNGRVESSTSGPSRIYIMDDDTPGLAVSRAFGDWVAATVGVICIPEVLVHEINESNQDQVIILGSDGIWEFITNERAVEIYAESKDPKIACNKIVDEATRCWKLNRDTVDDITCIVVELNRYLLFIY